MVEVILVTQENMQAVIQAAKDKGQRILALSPSKIVKGVVTVYSLVVQ
jgi:hypothetical protein